MKLIWHGHACFSIVSENGILVIDPYQDGSVPGLAPLRLTGDLTFKEIGKILNKTENWAKVTFFRGKQKIIKEIRL